MIQPKYINNILSVARQTCFIASTGEALGEAANLTDGTAISKFVVYHERLPTGRRASSPHSHSLREEFVFVLKGTPSVWIDGDSHTLVPGDYVTFAADIGTHHYLYNNGTEEAQYILIASLQEGDIISYKQPSTNELIT